MKTFADEPTGHPSNTKIAIFLKPALVNDCQAAHGHCPCVLAGTLQYINREARSWFLFSQSFGSAVFFLLIRIYWRLFITDDVGVIVRRR